MLHHPAHHAVKNHARRSFSNKLQSARLLIEVIGRYCRCVATKSQTESSVPPFNAKRSSRPPFGLYAVIARSLSTAATFAVLMQRGLDFVQESHVRNDESGITKRKLNRIPNGIGRIMKLDNNIPDLVSEVYGTRERPRLIRAGVLTNALLLNGVRDGFLTIICAQTRPPLVKHILLRVVYISAKRWVREI